MATDENMLGSARLEPDGPVVAGSMGQWTLTITVGDYGMDDGATILVTQRFATDWEPPQFDRPTESGYTTVTTNGDARLAARYDLKGYVRPYMKCMVIDVLDGSLAPGDGIRIVFGDRSAGSPGCRAQTFRETAHEFRVLVDPTNANAPRLLPDCPAVAVVTGPAVRLACVVPTQVVAGRPFNVFIRGEDEWDNPTPGPDGVRLNWAGEGEAVFNGATLTLGESAMGYVVADAGNGVTGISNHVTAYAEEPPLKRYWGDLHAQSDATVGTGTEEEYFAFGRDWARLDFISHQGNDFQVSDEDWRRLNETVRRFHEDGRFVVFPGYEWSGTTPAGGDRNVFYRREGLPIFRSSHWQVPEVPEDELSPAHPADVLFERLGRHCAGKALHGAHVGGRYADIRRYFDPENGQLLELASCWGIFEWLLWDALEMGCVVGVMCNSDGHKGRPGAEGPGAAEFGLYGGLTCVLAEDLTREAVFEALRVRRCYGTTGPRIDLDFTADGQPMGSIVRARGLVELTASARCAGPIESLTLYRGPEMIATAHAATPAASPTTCRRPEVVATARPAAFDDVAASRRVRVSWGGARMRGRGRRIRWDGCITVTGPRIIAAEPFAFDAHTDGIDEVNHERVHFTSATTGDVDGVDLMLADAQRGSVEFESPVGNCRIDLAELDRTGAPRRFDFGGLDVHVAFRRYPEMFTETHADLHARVTGFDNSMTPFFIKTVQCDGHMAWSSPVYVEQLPEGPRRGSGGG